jgi:heterodisulfide reductase subunit A
VQRLSDGKPPKRIAFIQCVGSRDYQCEADYCSSVCCMYAVKEAQITKEHLPSVEDIHIYYMDMRAYGKDFDRYIQSGKDKYGIKFIRSRASGVEMLDDGRLKLKSTLPDGTRTEDVYDMIVLASGFKANPETVEMFKKAGIKTDRYGFVHCDEFGAPDTSVDGIFACGAASGPKDIPETVAEASAAAAAAAKIANTGEMKEEEFAKYFDAGEEVPIRDVSNEPIRMGVFICRCGVNIGGYVDVPDVCEYIRTLPFVVHVEDSLYTCSVDAQKNMMDLIEKHNLNRVVVASCTPRTHEPLFQSVLKKTGLNPYLFNMSNIRDQCSWVHMDDKNAATKKAKELVRMAVGKGLLAVALQRKKIPVEHSAMVLRRRRGRHERGSCNRRNGIQDDPCRRKAKGLRKRAVSERDLSRPSGQKADRQDDLRSDGQRAYRSSPEYDGRKTGRLCGQFQDDAGKRQCAHSGKPRRGYRRHRRIRVQTRGIPLWAEQKRYYAA